MEVCDKVKFSCNYCNKKNIFRPDCEQHTKVCLDMPKPCQYCAIEVIRKNLWHHEAPCGAQEFTCTLCGNCFKRRDKADHLERDCKEATVACLSQTCRKKLKRKDLDAHMLVCGEVKELCPGECAMMVKRKYLPHSCVDYLKMQMRHARNKAAYRKEAMPYQSDLHKAFCKQEECK